MLVNTYALSGMALRYVVAGLQGLTVKVPSIPFLGEYEQLLAYEGDTVNSVVPRYEINFFNSADKIIDAEGIAMIPVYKELADGTVATTWRAVLKTFDKGEQWFAAEDSSRIVAALRCYVLRHAGNSVEVPDPLCKGLAGSPAYRTVAGNEPVRCQGAAPCSMPM